MNFTSRKRATISLLLTIIAAGLSIYFCFLKQSGDTYFYFNSDQLIFPYLFKNLFYDHGSFWYWTFGPVNYFFPDGLIFFVMALIVKDLKIAILLSCIIFYSLSYFFIVGIGCLTNGQENKNLFRISALLFLILVSYTEFFLPLFNSHFGSTFLMCLINIYLVLKLFEKPKFIYYFLLAVFCFLTNFSDLLFVVTFIAPAVAALLILAFFVENVRRKFLIRICFTLGLSGLLGYFSNLYDLFHFHIVHQPIEIHIFHAWHAFREKGLMSLYNEHPVYLLIDMCYVILILAILFNLYCYKRSKKLEYSNFLGLNTNVLFVLIIILGCCLSSIFAVIYFDTDLFTPGTQVTLHLIPAIILPVFLGVPILLAQYSNLGKILNTCYEIIPISVILNFFIVTQSYSLNFFIKFYPPMTQCLDNYSRKGYLVTKNGIAEYWDAHLNNVLSKENLHLVAVVPNLQPFDWMSTRLDYLNRKFNFVVISTTHMDADFDLNPVQVVKKLGKPDLILTCPNSQEYTIYNKELTTYSYNKEFTIYVYKKGFYIQ